MEIITISSAKETRRLLHFHCATCGKERFAEVTRETARTLLKMEREGTKVYLHCSTCPAPEMPEEDSLSASFEIETNEENIKRLYQTVKKEIDRVVKEKARLMEELERYKAEMKKHRDGLNQINQSIKNMDILLSKAQTTLRGSLRDAEEEINRISQWHGTVEKEPEGTEMED